MNSPSPLDIAVRMFASTERCELQLSREHPLVIRRGDTGEWALYDPSVTRSASGVAQLTWQNDELLLTPLSSDCAILVNGERIRTITSVRIGDRIRIGYTLFVLQELTGLQDGVDGLRTIQLRTEGAQQRQALGDEAERLAAWAESFDAVRLAGDDQELSAVVLPLLLRLGETDRAVLCQSSTDPEHPAYRELASRGYHGGELETLLKWLGDQSLPEGAGAPLIREITGRATAQRAAMGCVLMDGVRWVFVLEPPPLAAAAMLAQRGLSLLSNLLLLYQTLHGGQAQRRIIDELSATVRLYSRPLDETVYQKVRQQFVFRSACMQRVCRQLARAAIAVCPVLILGESGTGKQVAADAIHVASARQLKPMISVSLAESHEELIAADLFGTVKGAFNGAVNRQGLLQAAHDSSLFLDEIGEISMAVQTKLLRVLERSEFRRLGDTQITKVNTRLILATNRDLADEVRHGRFRADLFARINVVVIQMPPLRERLEDVPLLVAAFLGQANQRNQRQVRLSDTAIQHLQRYAWPDNVRGLQNYVERAVILAESAQAVLEPDDLPPLGTPALAVPPVQGDVSRLIDELQRGGKTNQARILRLMQSTESRLPKTEFANRLQISRPVLRSELRKLAQFGLRAGLDREFFESRIAMRPEDWAEIDRQDDVN
jgi:DNA-binding NtrC family response regulator